MAFTLASPRPRYAPSLGTASVDSDGILGASPLYRVVSSMVDKLIKESGGGEKPGWSPAVTYEDVIRCAK